MPYVLDTLNSIPVYYNSYYIINVSFILYSKLFVHLARTNVHNKHNFSAENDQVKSKRRLSSKCNKNSLVHIWK